MDRLDDVVKDCLDAVIQLRSADLATLPPPTQLHARFTDCVEQMLRKAADTGLSDQDARDVAYPVVALIDEVALAKGDAVRQRWQASPLQTQFFQETTAGESFFARLRELRADRHRQESLRAYYLCLCLGFEGRYRARGGDLELMALTDSLAKELASSSKHDLNTLSPPGKWPSASLVSRRPVQLLLWFSAATVALALAVYLGLWFSLKVSVGSSLRDISAAGLSSKAPSPPEEEQ